MAARFAYELRPPVDDLVHGLKYEGWKELAPFMGDALARLDLPRLSDSTDDPVVVAVPTTAARARVRGYNQAQLLADRMASALGWETIVGLERMHDSHSQTSLSPEERHRNVQGAFRATLASRALGGRQVILVDDVLTTGATVGAAAECLEGEGAGPVVVVTFARALQQGARMAA